MKCNKCDNKDWSWIYSNLKNTNIVSLEKTCNVCLSDEGWFENIDKYGRSTGIRGNQYLAIKRDYRGSLLEENLIAPVMIFRIFNF